MARVTVKTLAAAVGVSPATVSNAYNRPDQLSAELRARILATAEELGYTGPDAAGRTLRVGRAEAVGVLLTEQLSYAFSDPFAIEFLAGISEVVEEHGFSIVLMPLSHPDGDLRHPDLRAVRQAAIDALAILSLPPDHPAIRLAQARGIRIVATDPSQDPDASFVFIDDREAGRLTGRHLAGLGHRDVAVVVEQSGLAGGPPHPLAVEDVRFVDYAARLAGLAETLPGSLSVVSAGHNARPSGAGAAGYLLDRGDLPTAVVALSDVLALGVLDRLRQDGLDVPGTVSVSGFDDIPAAAEAGLTTVHQPIRLKGREVGRLLLDADATPRQVRLPVELVVRSSTGPAGR